MPAQNSRVFYWFPDTRNFMNTLIWFVILYWVISVGIGLYAARYVNNSKDFAVAGRSLPMYVVTATVFATWFGSEAVLGISSTLSKKA
jgi:Na+/proline symporter